MQKYIVLYHERAAIKEYDGGLSRLEAEKQARAEVQWQIISELELDMKDPKTYNQINKFKRLANEKI